MFFILRSPTLHLIFLFIVLFLHFLSCHYCPVHFQIHLIHHVSSFAQFSTIYSTLHKCYLHQEFHQHSPLNYHENYLNNLHHVHYHINQDPLFHSPGFEIPFHKIPRVDHHCIFVLTNQTRKPHQQIL